MFLSRKRRGYLTPPPPRRRSTRRGSEHGRREGPLEDSLGGTGHVDVVVRFPLDVEVAAGKLNGAVVGGDFVSENSSDENGASASATGEGRASAAFPNPHFERVLVDDLHETRC